MLKKVLNINGLDRTLIVDPDASLAGVLREQMMLTGCKVSCNQGQCGTCSIILNGELVRSCIVKMKKVADNAKITTIEGLGTPDNLHPLQVAWMAYGCAQIIISNSVGADWHACDSIVFQYLFYEYINSITQYGNGN